MGVGLQEAKHVGKLTHPFHFTELWFQEDGVSPHEPFPPSIFRLLGKEMGPVTTVNDRERQTKGIWVPCCWCRFKKWRSKEAKSTRKVAGRKELGKAPYTGLGGIFACLVGIRAHTWGVHAWISQVSWSSILRSEVNESTAHDRLATKWSTDQNRLQ